MMHLSTFLLCLLGFALLALAMERHQEDLFGHRLAPARTRGLRAAGWAALVSGLWVAVGGWGWALGLVAYSGHTSLCAGVIFGALIIRSRLATRAPAR